MTHNIQQPFNNTVHTYYTRNRMMITTNTGSKKRGAFILLEGVDRCGKTTQVSLLTKHLLNLSLATVAYRFPDRTTQGQ